MKSFDAPLSFFKQIRTLLRFKFFKYFMFLVALRHQDVSWTNVEISLMGFCGSFFSQLLLCIMSLNSLRLHVELLSQWVFLRLLSLCAHFFIHLIFRCMRLHLVNRQTSCMQILTCLLLILVAWIDNSYLTYYEVELVGLSSRIVTVLLALLRSCLTWSQCAVGERIFGNDKWAIQISPAIKLDRESSFGEIVSVKRARLCIVVVRCSAISCISSRNPLLAPGISCDHLCPNNSRKIAIACP